MLQVGVDIGHGHLKVVGLANQFGRISLVGAATVAIPTDVLSPTGVAARSEVGEALRLALREAKPRAIHSRRVVSALPASLALTKLLELPVMSRQELARAVPYEATQAFPVPTDDLSIDWQILRSHAPKALPIKPIAAKDGTTPAKVPGVPAAATTSALTQEVLLVGAPKPVVTGLVELFASVGLELVALEIKPLANARATTDAHETGTQLLLDIGAEDSSLVVLADGQIRHISTLKFGANGLSRPAPAPVKPKGRQKPIAKTPVTLDFLTPQLGPLAEEIDHVAKFAEQRLLGAGKIRRIRICGGGATISRLGTALERLTGLPTELANPLRHLHGTGGVTPEQALPLTTAIGLALREEQ